MERDNRVLLYLEEILNDMALQVKQFLLYVIQNLVLVFKLDA